MQEAQTPRFRGTSFYSYIGTLWMLSFHSLDHDQAAVEPFFPRDLTLHDSREEEAMRQVVASRPI